MPDRANSGIIRVTVCASQGGQRKTYIILSYPNGTPRNINMNTMSLGDILLALRQAMKPSLGYLFKKIK